MRSKIRVNFFCSQQNWLSNSYIGSSSLNVFSKRDVLFQTGVNAVEIYILHFAEDETMIKMVLFNCNANINCAILSCISHSFFKAGKASI